MSAYAEITVEQGATYTSTLTVSDSAGSAMNLAGYTAVSTMRKSYGASTGTNFTIVITPASGLLTISMPAATTANLAYGRYVYDTIIVSPSTVVTRVVEGTVMVTPRVSNYA